MDSEKDSSITHSGINTKNISIVDAAAQQALTGKSAEQTKSDILTTVTTDTAREHSGALANNFDKFIMVNPDVVSDDRMTIVARDIVKKIEDELEYPGQIKVHIIRENRAIEYAK